jgi:hypothetical protein
LSQIDSFDMKPDAPVEVRGDFNPIATTTPGLHVCEHLPMLAARSKKWAVLRSFAHKQPEHSAGHLLMLTGRSIVPAGFSNAGPKPTDWPSIAAIANSVTTQRNNLPPAVVLPTLIHRTGRTILPVRRRNGRASRSVFLELCAFNSKAYGAYPTYAFNHQQLDGTVKLDNFKFQREPLAAGGNDRDRFTNRLRLIKSLTQQRADWNKPLRTRFDRHRQRAVSPERSENAAGVRIVHVDPKTQDRYGRNTSAGRS